MRPTFGAAAGRDRVSRVSLGRGGVAIQDQGTSAANHIITIRRQGRESLPGRGFWAKNSEVGNESSGRQKGIESADGPVLAQGQNRRPFAAQTPSWKSLVAPGSPAGQATGGRSGRH